MFRDDASPPRSSTWSLLMYSKETRSCGSWLSFVEKWCIIL
jgi:hypothetical protein